METLYDDLIKLLRQALYSSDKTDSENAEVLANLLDKILTSNGIVKSVYLTQSEYDELNVKDSNTLYYVY